MKKASVWSVLLQLLPAFLVCSLFAAVGIVHVTSRVMVVRTGYLLSTAQNESRTLARDNDRLKLELATLKNPMRLEKLAREELHMAPPNAGTVLTLVSTPRLGRDAKDVPRPRSTP